MPILTANGVALHYDLVGPDGAPVIAFSNSLGTTLAMWDAQVPALAQRFRCLRYDTRGHGGSAVVDAAFAIDDLANDLAALMDGLGIERAHVVGVSLGGMTAQALAASAPERVDRLVLMATTAHLPPAESWTERAATVRRDGLAPIVAATGPRWFTAGFRDAPDARAVLTQLSTTDRVGYARACEAIARMDLRDRLAAIVAPTLIVSGTEDPSTPAAMGEALHRGIAGSTFLVLPHAAHLLNVEQASIVNAQLAAFLGTDATPHRHASYEAGLANRKAVLGASHVERSLARAGAFAGPWQDFITRYAWGEIWGDAALPWKTRSLVTLALMVALGREEEFKLHVAPAFRNGVTPDELRALLKQIAVYAGVPAANAAFRWVSEVVPDVGERPRDGGDAEDRR